jgi:ATP-dependent RNA helicase SUPV3L1/SUV3
MLERLADQLRSEDSRGGFEAKADMLSITGMTLEHFSDLMLGLGYNCDRAERVKVKPAAGVAEPDKGAPDSVVGGADADTPVAAAELIPEDAGAEPDKVDAAGSDLEATAEPVLEAGPTTEPETMADAGLAPETEHVSMAASDDAAVEYNVVETPAVEKDALDSSGLEAGAEPSEPVLGSPDMGSEIAPETAPVMEVVYTFTWGRSGAASRPKGQGRRNSGAGADATGANSSSASRGDRREASAGGATDQKSRDGKPQDGKDAKGRSGQNKSGQNKSGHGNPKQGKSGRDKFNRDGDKRPGKGKPRRDDGPKQFAASPKRTEQIDPDNPFAVALMGMKDKI